MKKRLESYITKILANENISFSDKNKIVLEDFVADEDNISSMQIIIGQQEELKTRIMSKLRIFEIQNQHIQIPNATFGKEYNVKLDFVKLGLNDIVLTEFEGLEDKNLIYDNETETISGVPNQSGDFKIKFKYRIKGELDDSKLNEKILSFIINANPKDLWKDLPSDQQDKYWKENNVFTFEKLGYKNIAVASKRGRSHANVGSFRDDDFSFKHFDQTGWSVVAVSDGAGSAKYSRKGSELACAKVINYFENELTSELSTKFDTLISSYHQELNNGNTAVLNNVDKSEEADFKDENDVEVLEVKEEKVSIQSEISKFIYSNLGACAKAVYNCLEEFSIKNEFSIKDLHSTLIFSLFKKYDFGYVVLSFGVGDCPIGILNKDFTEFKLMNWLDVGDFGGGTRFITMPEIFVSDKFSTRFGFKIIDDFSYLILMTDGIYDAKFVVEANLEKLEKWNEFLADLGGHNDDKIKVDFEKRSIETAESLSKWMDFWSPGNHDDRTLALIY